MYRVSNPDLNKFGYCLFQWVSRSVLLRNLLQWERIFSNLVLSYSFGELEFVKRPFENTHANVYLVKHTYLCLLDYVTGFVCYFYNFNSLILSVLSKNMIRISKTQAVFKWQPSINRVMAMPWGLNGKGLPKAMI